MQDQTPEGSHGLEMSPQSSVHRFRPQPSHHSASNSNLETSPQHPSTQLPNHPQISNDQPTPEKLEAPSSPLTPASPLISYNPQMHHNQQVPNDPLMPEFQQTNYYPLSHSCAPTHDYPTQNSSPTQGYPAAQGYPPTHSYHYEHHPPLTPHYQPTNYHPQMAPYRHPLIDSQAHSSASPFPYPGAGGADKGPDFESAQPNTEPDKSPIPRYPPLNYQGIGTRHLSPAQTQINSPAVPYIPHPGNTDHGELNKDKLSPNTRMPAAPPMSHTIPPAYPLTGLPPLSTIAPLIDNPEKEVLIAVMGVTGTGKSYFIREVSGISDVEVSSSLHSCTAEVQSYSFPYASVKVTLVDTPGFNDTTRSDTKVLAEICAWMSSNYKEGKLLSGIIYLHRITDVRIDGTSLKNFKMFQRMCGPDALQNVLLTTTQWSNVNPALGEEREGNLLHEDFWGEFISQGASLERFMGTRESGLELIRKLIEKEPKLLHIQDEIEVKGMTLVETNVGKFMNEELISLQKKYEKDLENLERERQNAIKEKDNELEMILEQEQANARGKQEEASAERKLLADLHEAQIGKLEEALRKMNKEREKDDRAVIAVDSKDISGVAHLRFILTSFNTKGRLVYDIDDLKEFMKDPINITIHNHSIIAWIGACMKPIGEIFDAERNINKYIIYNGERYWCEAHSSIRRNSQKFFIFRKTSPKRVVGSKIGAMPHV